MLREHSCGRLPCAIEWSEIQYYLTACYFLHRVINARIESRSDEILCINHETRRSKQLNNLNHTCNILSTITFFQCPVTTPSELRPQYVCSGFVMFQHRNWRLHTQRNLDTCCCYMWMNSFASILLTVACFPVAWSSDYIFDILAVTITHAEFYLGQSSRYDYRMWGIGTLIYCGYPLLLSIRIPSTTVGYISISNGITYDSDLRWSIRASGLRLFSFSVAIEANKIHIPIFHAHIFHFHVLFHLMHG